MLQPSNLLQSRLYVYRNEFPNVYLINNIFIIGCDEYYHGTRNLATLEEYKDYIESIPPTWDSPNYFESMVNLCAHFLMFLEHQESIEIFRDKPLVLIYTAKKSMFNGQNYQDYLVLFNCMNEYLQYKLNNINK